MAAPTVPADTHAPDQPRSSALSVLVVGPGFTSTFTLPSAGSVVIGRAEDAELRIVDPQASRQHARLHVGASIAIEDLGSANGTRVRDEPLAAGQRVSLGPGDGVSIGSTMLIIRRVEGTGADRVSWPHGYFEARLVEEIARAERVRGELALLRVSAQTGTTAELAAIVKVALRPGDFIGEYGPRELAVLLPDSARAPADELAGRVTQTLAGAGLSARTAAAFFPGDGNSAAALFSAAAARLRGVSSRGRQAGNEAGPYALVESAAMRELHALVARVAASNINVLVVGETGAGKEVIANAIHLRSRRASGPLVAINCAALPETLLESELFGHEKGAFSGAVAAKVGLLESAAGGTVFLDEVGEMSAALQAKLLRTLESRTILRVGGTSPLALDVRFVAATNRDLEEDVANEGFRSDLYFRLNGITLTVPPLRERVEEIVPLARLFLERAAAESARPPPALTAAAVAVLEAYAWPGNVRELRNVMERALLFAEGSVVDRDHLPLEKLTRARVTAPRPVPVDASEGRDFRDRQVELERVAILDALARCGGNQTRAAEYLNMPRRTFCNRLTEFGIRTARGKVAPPEPPGY